MRVVICGCADWDRRGAAFPDGAPHLGRADVDGANHDQSEHANANKPFSVGDRDAGRKQARLEKIQDVAGAEDNERPAGAALPGHAAPPSVKPHHSLPPRCLATLSRSLSPRPERLTTSR